MSKLPKVKRDQILYVAAGTFAIITVLWLFVVQEQEAGLRETIAKTAESRNKVSRAEGLVRQAAVMEKKLATLEMELEAKESQMAPERDSYDWMLKTIRTFVQFRKGINPMVIDQPRPEAMKLIPKFPYSASVFHVTATGFYHEFGKFVADFENNFRYFQIENMEIAPVGALGSSLGMVPISSADAELLKFSFDIVTPVKVSAPTTTTK